MLSNAVDPVILLQVADDTKRPDQIPVKHLHQCIRRAQLSQIHRLFFVNVQSTKNIFIWSAASRSFSTTADMFYSQMESNEVRTNKATR